MEGELVPDNEVTEKMGDEMGSDELDRWRVKTLDEILEEKRKRKETNMNDEEQGMVEDDNGDVGDSLEIKPPQYEVSSSSSTSKLTAYKSSSDRRKNRDRSEERKHKRKSHTSQTHSDRNRNDSSNKYRTERPSRKDAYSQEKRDRVRGGGERDTNREQQQHRRDREKREENREPAAATTGAREKKERDRSRDHRPRPSSAAATEPDTHRHREARQNQDQHRHRGGAKRDEHNSSSRAGGAGSSSSSRHRQNPQSQGQERGPGQSHNKNQKEAKEVTVTAEPEKAEPKSKGAGVAAGPAMVKAQALEVVSSPELSVSDGELQPEVMSAEEEGGGPEGPSAEEDMAGSSLGSGESGSGSEGSRTPSDSGPSESGGESSSSTGSSSRSPSEDGDEDKENNSGGESDGEYAMSRSPSMSPVELQPLKLPPYLPAVLGCRSVEEYQCLNRIEEGTYGVVYKAKEKKTDEIVALKRLKMEKEKEGFPITSLREINTLLKAQHPNIVTVREIVVGSNMDKIYIVMDFVEHDLKALMENMKNPFSIGEVKCLLLQLLRAVAHLHDNWILHRDLKTSNLLLSQHGILKVGDFGLAREYGSPLKDYTPVVVTLWYRAPELLLGTKEYSTKIDMWSVGCIFAEFLTMKPLFPGKSEIDQINKIFKELGTPNNTIWPGYDDLPMVKKATFTRYAYNSLRNRFGANLLTDKGFEIMNKMLTYNPGKRISAEEAVKHAYFGESPLPCQPMFIQTNPNRKDLANKKAVTKMESPKAPAGGMFSQLEDDIEVMDSGKTATAAAGALGFRLTTASQGASSKGPGFNLKF